MTHIYTAHVETRKGVRDDSATRLFMGVLAPQLRALREAVGLRQVDLGLKIGLSQSMISLIESGEPTTSDVVERWAEACGAVIDVRRAEDRRHLALHAAAMDLLESDLSRLTEIALSLPDVPDRAKDGLIIAMKAYSGDAPKNDPSKPKPPRR